MESPNPNPQNHNHNSSLIPNMAEPVPEPTQTQPQSPPVDTESINTSVNEVLGWVKSLEEKLQKIEEEDVSNAASITRMNDLIRQFGSTIYRQITHHKFSGPFMYPVDVKALGLHDYFDIIEKPMDFNTIKTRMEAKDGSGYKHIMEVYSDMRLVFDNAMKYNEESSDVHTMAKTLLGFFQEKWVVQFVPKVKQEEKVREEEEKRRVAMEASRNETASELRNEIGNVNEELEKLRNVVVKNCRKITCEEKRIISRALLKLSADDLQKVLGIVAKADPRFQAKAEEVDIELDRLDHATLWRLKFFVREALENKKKKKKEVIVKTENREFVNKRNASNRIAERRTKRARE